MNKLLLLLECLILISCNKTYTERANNLINASDRYHTIGSVEKLDSIISYKEPFMMRCAALQMQWYDDSVMRVNKYYITQKQAKELRSNINMIYRLKTEAARKELELRLSRIKDTFVGYSAMKKTPNGSVIIYFDEKLKRILGVEYDN